VPRPPPRRCLGGALGRQARPRRSDAVPARRLAIGDDRAFRAAATHALGIAVEHDVLVTVGVKPTRNETGYGYIVPGKPLGSARKVKRFIEKPSPARARCYGGAARCGIPACLPGARRGSSAKPRVCGRARARLAGAHEGHARASLPP